MSIAEAEQFEENEQFDKAYEEYKKIYSQRPKSIEVLERLGHLSTILDKKPEAEEYYHKIIELDPTSTLAYEQLMDLYVHSDRYKYYISRGNMHVVEGQLSHAINDFKKALDKAQTEEEMLSSRFILANLYEQTAKFNQAIDEYLRIIDSKNTNEIVFLRLAKIYIQQDALSSAVEILERARSSGFDTIDIKENLAQLYLRTNNPEKARELSQDELVKVKSLLDEDKNEQAFEMLEMVKNKYTKNAQYHSLLAQYYYNAKKFDEALMAVEEFFKLDADSPLTYQMKALIYEEKGEEADAHINWAKYNLAKGDKDVALNEYFSAYQIKENDAIIVRNIAELLEDMNDKHQAAEFWEKLTQIDPQNRKALEKTAQFRANVGDYRSQSEILEKLYLLDSKNALVIKNLAQAYEKSKNKEKALEFYKKFLQNSPVNDDYEAIQLKLKKLENTEFEEDEGLIGKIMKLFSK